MSLTFTLKGVETKNSVTLAKRNGVRATDKLIKSAKPLVIKTPKTEPSFFDRSNLKNALKARFNEVLVGKKGEEYPVDCHYPCDWCRRQFDCMPLGIPINYRLRDNGLHAYKCDGYLCSFECALAFVRRDASGSHHRRDPLYRDSEALLKSMFVKLHGDKKLREACDWRLLRDNGGDLGDEEAAKFTRYYRTPNVRVTPMSVVYQQY